MTTTGWVIPTSSATDLRSGPSSLPGSISERKDGTRQFKSLAKLIRPGACARIEKLGGRGVCMLTGAPAGQQPAKEVWHHQECLGHIQQRRPGLFQSEKLVNRVKRQKL